MEFDVKEKLIGQIEDRSARVAILGLGYVGLPLAVVLEGRLEKEQLQGIFQHLVKRHESLRTFFDIINGSHAQRVRACEEVEFAMEYYDLAAEERRQMTDDRRQRRKQVLICHLSSVICRLSSSVLLIYPGRRCCGLS